VVNDCIGLSHDGADALAAVREKTAPGGVCVGGLDGNRRCCEDYKVHFMIQEAHGFDVWKNPYTPQGWPSLVDLRSDPFERGMHESIGYSWWATKRMFAISGAAVITTEFLKTFLEFPPRQSPGSFSVDGIIQQLEAARAGNR
jgi:arylsulfatase